MDCLLVFLMSLDALLACLALGAQGIRVEPRSRCVIAGVGAGCLALSFVCSGLLQTLLPAALFHYISCGALLVIALLCLQIYAETAQADADRSGTLSPSEALLLALPLSLDSLLTGLSIVAAPAEAFALLMLSFACGLIAAAGGERLGRRLGHAAGQSASLVSGLLLLMVALCKLRL